MRIASLIVGTSLSLWLAVTPLATAVPSDDGAAASATAYITMDSLVPADADLSRGDVPRDSYGRPWMYEGLGLTLPDFVAETTDGRSFGSRQLAGQWTVIQVWGIWCHDSMHDAPYAAALASALDQDADVDFLTIHTPYNQDTMDRATKSYASVADWFTEKGYTYPTLVDHDASLRSLLKIRWTPSYLVIAPDLSVQGFRTGLSDVGDDAVKGFVQDIAATRAAWQSSQGR